MRRIPSEIEVQRIPSEIDVRRLQGESEIEIMIQKLKTMNWENWIAGIATIFRVWFGSFLGQWLLALSTHDDALLVKYADFSFHYANHGVLPQQALVKESMFPLFLNLVHISGLGYATVVSLLWVVTALCVCRTLRLLTDNRRFLLFAYIFVLFTPCAFEVWLGTRIYRNGIIAPFVFITFSLYLYMFFLYLKKTDVSIKKYISNWCILGLVTFFTAYIKEDGAWLLASMLAVVFACICVSVQKKSMKMALLVLLPVVVYFGALNIYKAVNDKYFGIYETNTRTNGELAEFVNNIYKIDAEGRTESVWAPADAIEKAYAVSETFQSYPEMHEHMVNTAWRNGSIVENPITGDFLTWIARDAVYDSGLWESEAKVAEIFGRINDEIELAFEDGRLKEDPKFRLVASTGGRTKEELYKLPEYMKDLYLTVFRLHGYIPGGAIQEEFDAEVTGIASEYCNANLSPLIGAGKQAEAKRVNSANKIVGAIFFIYKWLHPILCLISLVGFIMTMVYLFTSLKKKEKFPWMTFWVFMVMIGLILLSLVYSLCICWFASFIMSARWLSYYSSGLIALVGLIELIGVYLFDFTLRYFVHKQKVNL